MNRQAGVSCYTRIGCDIQLVALLMRLCSLSHCSCRKVSDYQPVFDLRGQRDIEVAKQLTGREYLPTKYWLDTDPDMGTRNFMVSMLYIP